MPLVANDAVGAKEKQRFEPMHVDDKMKHGGVAEWSNAPVLKTGEPQGSVGSNPTSSAMFPWRRALLPKAVLGFGVVLVLLAAVALVSYRSTVAFIHSAEGSAHTHEIIELERMMQEHLVEMASARRGFLLAGSEAFLRDWEMAKQNITADLTALRRSASEAPQQKARLARTELLMAQSFALQEKEIAARREQGAEAATELFKEGEAIRVLNQIQTLIAEMDQELKSQLGRRAELMQQISHATIAAVLAGSALAFLAILGACAMIVRDVKALQRADDALAVERNLLRQIIDALPDYVYVKDVLGRYILDNRAHREYIRQPSSMNIAGQSVSGLFPAHRAQIFKEEDRYVIEGGEAIINREERVEDGEADKWIQTTKVPLRNRTGEIIGLVGVSADITDRRAAEEKLRRFTSQLERSNADLQDFASVASHDLQEPLRKIQAFGGRLRTRCAQALGSVGLDYLERMESAAQRMQSLIQDLLKLSRVTSHAKPFEECDMAEIVRAVISDLEVAIEQADAAITVGPLPRIQADPAQMRQLFQNLISNALKFRRPDRQPRITITGRVLDTQNLFSAGLAPAMQVCEIRVQDNGIGFDPKFSEQIFVIFQRLHARDEYEGTGVGLALCRKITDRHNGTIVAKAEDGQGATLIVTLPVQQHSDEVHE